jgi:hypothetical protein
MVLEAAEQSGPEHRLAVGQDGLGLAEANHGGGSKPMPECRSPVRSLVDIQGRIADHLYR